MSYAAFSAVQYTYVNDTVDFTRPGADVPNDGDFYIVDPLNDGGFYRFYSTTAQGFPYNWPERITFETANTTFATPNIYYDASNNPLVFNQNDPINTSSAAFGGSPSSISIRETGSTTIFSLNTTYYLPMFLTSGTGDYVGWIKIRVLNNESSIVVESYAFNDTPNGTIYAGEGTPLSLNELTSKSSISVVENPFSEELKIVNSSIEDVTIELYSVNGELMKYLTVKKGTTKVSLTELNSGVYLLKDILKGEVIRIVKK